MPRAKAKQPTTPDPCDFPPLGDRLALTINETASVLSIHRDSVYKLLHSGELVASKVAGRTVVHVASIQRLLANSVFKPGPRYRGPAGNAFRITRGRDAQTEVSVPDTEQ